PDGDALTYTASSSSPANATSSVLSGSLVTVWGLAKGNATVTVTATDPEGLAATQTFRVTVPNRAPEAVGTIADREVAADATAEVDVSRHFTDPDGDRLTYAAKSSKTHSVGVSVSGSTVTVRGVAKGSATVTVTATDPEGLAATQTFRVTVPNRVPKAAGNIPDQKMEVDDNAEIDVEDYFSDPDGDDLTYTARSSKTNVATVSVSGSTVTIRAVATGSATVTVTARDPGGLTATQRAGVTVRQTNRAPKAVGNIPDQKMKVDTGVEIDVEDYFSDPDGDDLTYTARSSKTNVATVSVSGSTVTIRAVAAGRATVTVTARDPGRLTARQTASVSVIAVTSPDREVLVALYEATDGPNWRDNTNWLTDKPLGEWYGVDTNASGRVVGLDLRDNRLAGEIPPELGDLSNLENLNLRRNSLTGEIPRGLGDLADLEELYLDDNDLSGEIPLDFVDLSLTTFYWDGNTGLCSPATKSFQDWLRSIDDHRGGKACGTFDLEMNFTSGVSSTVRSHIEEARDEWELVLKNTEFDDIRVNRTLSCLGIRGYVGTIDDHRLFVHADSIDGEGGILAVARYCYRRTSDGSPLLSATVIDEDDIEEMIDEDALVPVVFHEMGHALGFPGYWFYHDLVDTLDADDPHFEGELAIEAFDDAGGDDYDGEKVPIQLRRYGHWRESVFGDEIMSPFIDLENDEAPVSAITLQSFADVGYKVDVSRADDYELPDTQDRRSTGRVFDLSNDVVWGPVIVLDTDGRVVRVIPPPPGAERWPLPRREVLIEPRRPPRHGSTPPSSGSRSR
ncbi:MAG: Ig-like domain-containing protein, partial [Deltaproteobacteria bacterium]|nr:Ig-like domain-containing protein [Deltaproteobacteria bacterium]